MTRESRKELILTFSTFGLFYVLSFSTFGSFLTLVMFYVRSFSTFSHSTFGHSTLGYGFCTLTCCHIYTRTYTPSLTQLHTQYYTEFSHRYIQKNKTSLLQVYTGLSTNYCSSCKSTRVYLYSTYIQSPNS